MSTKLPIDDVAPLTHDNFFAEIDRRSKNDPQDEKNSSALIKFINGEDFMDTTFPTQQWLVNGLIPEKGLVCLSGMPSSYKSWFGFYIALCILKGSAVLENPIKGFPGWKTDRGGVLFIDKENIEHQIQERLKMLGAGEEVKNCYFVQGNFTTENLKSLADIVQFVKEKNIKLVIIDSLIRVHSRNENEAVEMNKVFERLSEIQHAGSAILYLHHLRKSTSYSQDPMERLRGSIDISARLDSLIALENDEKNIIKVHHGKSRYIQAFPSFIMRFEVDQYNKAFFNYEKEIEPGTMEGMLCSDAIYAVLKENSYTRKHLIEKLSEHYSESAIEKAITSLYREGKIEKHGEGREVIYGKNKLYEFTQRKLLDEDKKDLN